MSLDTTTITGLFAVDDGCSLWPLTSWVMGQAFCSVLLRRKVELLDAVHLRKNPSIEIVWLSLYWICITFDEFGF